MPFSGASVEFLAVDAGQYAFRVDIPRDARGFTTIQTGEAVLDVADTRPIIQSDPPFDVVEPGSDVTFVLNARGILEDQYKFTWFTGPSAQGPWTPIPVYNLSDLNGKSRRWDTIAPGPGPGTSPGQYYARVQATRKDGTASYTFTSDTPAVTVFQR
jgi:hypothetical protein